MPLTSKGFSMYLIYALGEALEISNISSITCNFVFHDPMMVDEHGFYQRRVDEQKLDLLQLRFEATEMPQRYSMVLSAVFVQFPI